MSAAEYSVRTWLEKADVLVGGDRPWDISVHERGLYRRVMRFGSLGVGESWMDGWFSCTALDQMIERVLASDYKEYFCRWQFRAGSFLSLFHNLQNRARSLQIGHRHYDIDNELFQRMLDRRMIYSCGWWSDGAKNLEQAQEAKLALIAAKLDLRPGMRVLDIGCGWGGAAAWYAEHYDVHVTGITISRQQWEYAQSAWSQDRNVEFLLMDYRDLEKEYDAIYSIGMFEHVGVRNYPLYMSTVRRCLKPKGLFLLHTCGGNEPMRGTDPWLMRYIFPNGMLPSPQELGQALQGHFMLDDWHSFGPDYDRTLLAWYRNFVAAWPELAPRYGERFRRMWEYYLLSCAAAFRVRHNSLWQLLLSDGQRQKISYYRQAPSKES